jgi:hypothetical protein
MLMDTEISKKSYRRRQAPTPERRIFGTAHEHPVEATAAPILSLGTAPPNSFSASRPCRVPDPFFCFRSLTALLVSVGEAKSSFHSCPRPRGSSSWEALWCGCCLGSAACVTAAIQQHAFHKEVVELMPAGGELSGCECGRFGGAS